MTFHHKKIMNVGRVMQIMCSIYSRVRKLVYKNGPS